MVQVKSDCLFNGYWEDLEKTKAEFTSDGFFNTGDLGFIDDQGFIFC